MEELMEIKIGSRLIGPNHPTYFIADIAANHDGDLERAKMLIRLAKEAGADAAKFQNFDAPKIVSDYGFKAMSGGQVSHQAAWKKSVFEVYKGASIPFDWSMTLVEECNEVGIDYFSSPYDFNAIDFLDQYVPVYKAGSGEIDWIEALERSSRDVVARLGKGRAYARDGHVHGLKVAPGKVTATVTDDELDSYGVSLNLEVFDARAWNQILQAMSQQALFAAQLLNGEMPRDVDRLFRSCGKSLFPANSHDIDADCSCDDWSSPCKHVAATHYVLGEALDRDPFLLFELRGMLLV
jgi:hypothetical protein